MDRVDVAIIGAGAAGLAAARRLCDEPVSHLILEARDRLGGRAHTVEPMAGWAIDLGCGWLHSADKNPLAQAFEAAGRVIDKTPPHWERQSENRNFSAEQQRAFASAFAAFDATLEREAAHGVDRPASDFLEPGCPWNALIDAVSSYYNGVEYSGVSLLDYANYLDTDVNWRVRDGYGAAIADLSRPQSVKLGCAVETIDHGGKIVRLHTSLGMLEARAVIITVPTPHLAEGRLRFTPDLPHKREAAANLPLGLADKVFLHLDRPQLFAAEAHLFGRTDRTATGSYHLRPFGRPYIEAFVGGACARTLEDEDGASAAFALDELTALYGSDIRRCVTPVAATAWLRDPWALGAYSHARPGFVQSRSALAAPVERRLFFAGEATSTEAYSTAHGAWLTGLRAAAEALAALD